MRHSFMIAVAAAVVAPAVAVATPDTPAAGTVRHVATYQVDGMT